MSEKKVYDYIIDGSNVLYENKLWGDKKTIIDEKDFYAINVDRLKLAVQYFEERGYNVLVCVDYSTTLKKAMFFKTSKSKFNKYIDEIQAVKIQNDSNLVELKRDNPNSIILTNDGFPKWISGQEEVPKLSISDWQKEKKERKEFGFKDDKFTLARKNNKFTGDKELANKAKDSKQVKNKKSDDSNFLDSIRSRLQSLDDRTQSQTTKINNINSIVQDLSTQIKELSISSTKSNSSALIPCKVKDEFGQSHLCLLGENLHIWRDGTWIQIQL